MAENSEARRDQENQEQPCEILQYQEVPFNSKEQNTISSHQDGATTDSNSELASSMDDEQPKEIYKKKPNNRYQQFDSEGQLTERDENSNTNTNQKEQHQVKLNSTELQLSKSKANPNPFEFSQSPTSQSKKQSMIETDEDDQGSKSARMSKPNRVSLSFNSGISSRIDKIIDDFAAKKEARELFIPGLDDYQPNVTEVTDDVQNRPKQFKAQTGLEPQSVITGNVSNFQTSFNMFKVFVGIGILATPSAFSQVGIIGGSLGVAFVGAINLYTMKLQIACKTRIGPHVTSYSDLGEEVFGAIGKGFIDFCISVSQIGFCIAYLLFIGNQMDQVVCFETQQEICGNKSAYIAFAAFILVPICWLRSFKYLAFVSVFASGFLVIALIIIVKYSFNNIGEYPEMHEDIYYLDLTMIPLFFGIAVFDFEGNGIIINLHASMKNPEDFDKILNRVITCVVAILIFFSAVCYYSYGNEIEDMVTLNLPHDNLTSLIQIFYCFGLLGSFPMQIMPAYEITEKTKSYQKCPTPDKFPACKRLTMRTLFVILVAVLAMVVPKFGLFINLTGAFVCTALAFVLPVMMYNKLFASTLTKRMNYAHKTLLVFGIIVGSISFFLSLFEIIKAFQETDSQPVIQIASDLVTQSTDPSTILDPTSQ